MAFDTYANLKAAIRTWSKRTDLSDDQIDEFIDLAEESIFDNPDEILQTLDGETRATASTSITSRYLALPTGYLSMRRLRINVSGETPTDVTYQPPEVLFVYPDAGRPNYFTVTSQLELDRLSDQVYEIDMQYQAKFTVLSSGNTTNFVLTNHPKIYMFGSLWALNLWSKKEEEASYYWSMFIDAVRGANKQYRKGRYGPAPFMRIEGDTP